MTKTLIDLIDEGKIKTLDDLKSAYHKIVMKTHPDAVGSEKLLAQYLSFTDQYEEAKGHLLNSQFTEKRVEEYKSISHKIKFFVNLGFTEAIEKLKAYEYSVDDEKMLLAKKQAEEILKKWREDQLVPENEDSPIIMVEPALPKNVIAFRVIKDNLYLIRAHKDQRLTLHKLAEKQISKPRRKYRLKIKRWETPLRIV